MTDAAKPGAPGKAKRKQGRPTGYTEKLGQEICARMAEGRSLRSVCSDEDMPGKQMVCRWLAKYPVFRDQYATLADVRALILFEDILDIADDGTKDRDGDGAVDYEHISRSRLRIDARKWFLSKLAPKKYADRVEPAKAEGDGDIRVTGGLPDADRG